jgi:hypothetical protein
MVKQKQSQRKLLRKTKKNVQLKADAATIPKAHAAILLKKTLNNTVVSI